MRQSTKREATPRSVVLAMVLVLALASYSQAGISIVNVDHLNLPANTTTLQVPIFMAGLPTDVVDNYDLSVMIYGPGFTPNEVDFPTGPSPTIDYLGSGGINGLGVPTGNFMSTSPSVFIGPRDNDQYNILGGVALTTPGANIPV